MGLLGGYCKTGHEKWTEHFASSASPFLLHNHTTDFRYQISKSESQLMDLNSTIDKSVQERDPMTIH